MKLPIKKKYFDAIKAGYKNLEFRDAHITFVCEETGSSLIRQIAKVEIIDHKELPSSIDKELFDDERILKFELR